MAARLFRLKPGASIERHIDPFFGFEYGKLRLHAPIITSEAALMVFGDDSVHWSAGRLWYGDFGRVVHTVTNSAAQSRVHLVIDCLINSMLLDAFPESHRPECVMLNRTVVTGGLPPAIGVGHWSVSVLAKAFDWTNSLDIEGELQGSFWVDEMTYEPFLTLPSGITAKLRPLGGKDYRIGFMPEESMVRILEDTIEIVRRVGDHLEVYSCTFKETSSKITH